MKSFIVGGVILFLLSTGPMAQQGLNHSQYKMKPLPIQTRWAKDVNPKNVLPDYPRPQMVRNNWINLNGIWHYTIVANELLKPAKFDSIILVPYPLESALSGVKKDLQPGNVLWYKKVFASPVLQSEECLLLNFGAVSWETNVYINGRQVGNHTGSYTSFSIDITKYVRQGENELLVKVSNPLEKGTGPRGKQSLSPGTIWYTPSSGIWQTVWLETVPSEFIENLIIIPDIDQSTVNIKVNSTFDTDVQVETDNKKIRGKTNTLLTIPIQNAKLWSPETPYLYELKIKLGRDDVQSYFGMRKVEIKKDAKGVDRIFLNNKYTYNLGTLDQGFWPDGLYTAPTDDALKFDIQAIKAMGFNTIRKHIKIEPARWYYHADKLGILVWQDLVQPAVPLEDAGKVQFEKESMEMLQQLQNSPSITTWVLFNESWGEYDQDRLTKWVKTIDPTRLVNGHSGAAIISGSLNLINIKEVVRRSINSDMTDVHSYPPPAMPYHVDGKAMVLGEFGGIAVQMEGHLWDDIAAGWGYGQPVGAGTMQKNYATMVDSLIAFEKLGLSASIYTQLFDVESEQNGLMTYDREIIKIPIGKIRAIHARLLPLSPNATTKNFTATIADTAMKSFAGRLKEYRAGKKDSASLRALAILAHHKKDYETASQIGNEYIKQLRSPLTEDNIKFIQTVTYKSKDTGYSIILNNLDKVKTFMNPKHASYKVQGIIYEEQIKRLMTDDPDWNTVNKIIERYPQIDGEFIIGNCVIHYMVAIGKNEKNAIKNTISAASLYDKRYNGGAYNEWAWIVFENSADSTDLSQALRWSHKSLVQDPINANYVDTYANLLHKLGRTQEAIHWEQKALALKPDNDEFKQALNKMEAGQATWPTPNVENHY